MYLLWNPIIETAKIQVQRSDYMTFVFPTTVPSLYKVVLYKSIILPETHITLDPRDKKVELQLPRAFTSTAAIS
jgi:hypothetical protein